MMVTVGQMLLWEDARSPCQRLDSPPCDSGEASSRLSSALQPRGHCAWRQGRSGERPCGQGPDLCPVKLRITVLLLGWHGCVFSLKLVFRISETLVICTVCCTMTL